MDREKIINDYMVKLKISREEAEQLFEDDENDFIGEDGEAMTEKAKANRHREESGKKRKQSTRQPKIDELKVIQMDILSAIQRFCISHGIRYSMGCGTMLGCARHKGYKPWEWKDENY